MINGDPINARVTLHRNKARVSRIKRAADALVQADLEAAQRYFARLPNIYSERSLYRSDCFSLPFLFLYLRTYNYLRGCNFAIYQLGFIAGQILHVHYTRT